MPTSSLLFVCLGNICRSPMAEGAMRDAAARAGLQIETDSAGTGTWHEGHHPDPRAQSAAARHGCDIADLRARKVRTEDFYRFDHIIALDAENLKNLRRLDPGDGKAQLSLMLDHVPGQSGRSVDDPYYGGDEGFERVWKQVSAGAEGLLNRMKAQRQADRA